MKSPSAIELLESRIAPALIVLHPIPDIVPGIGATGATLDLGNAFDAAGNFRTHVQFTTNYIDPLNPAQPQIIELELFDDKAPVTVANFLRYVNGLAPSDLDGVFFHRSVPGFVLQGGGFATDAPGSHIAIDPEVHNEFTAGDAERSNLVGTVAMAKTGLGPHTATSEWFVNLANNAANLDNQNGGFTVFAKVTQGMNVVNAIAALGTRNLSGLNGALTNVPLQNYDPDPDGNPATPPPTPTAAQFLTITDASVIAPAPANAAGISFSVVSITDATTQAATDLVTGTVAGQSLQLQYKAGASGVAKVTVKASKSGEADVFEDFLVTVKPNLIVTLTSDPLPQVIVPGDKANVGVLVTNSGAASIGNFDVRIHLSKTLPDFDMVIGTLTNQSLASGATLAVPLQASIPQSLLLQQGASFRVTAEVLPSGGASGIELFSDDNVNVNTQQGHTLFNAFGTFSVGGVGGRSNAPMTYVDAAGETVTARLTGGGFGLFDPTFAGSIGVLSLRATTADSIFSIVTGNASAQTVLDSITIDDPLGTANLGNVTVKGNFDALKGIKTLTLGNIGDGTATHTLSIGAFAADAAQKATITLGKVHDVALTSGMPLGALNAVEWLDSNASRELITAPAIDTVFITGDATHSGVFQAGFAISGATKLQSFRLAYLDPASQPITLTVVGGGYGQFDPLHNGSAGVLEVYETTAASALSLVAANGSVQTLLDKVRIVTPLGTAALENLTVTGDFEALAGVANLTIGDATGLELFRLGYRDSVNQPITLTITGGGYGQFDPQHNGSVEVMEVRDTNAASVLTLVAATASVKTQLAKLSITAPLGTAALGNLALKGDFEALGGIKTLTLGNIGDGTATHALSIGAFAADPAQKATITLGQARDMALTSAMPLASLSAVDWLDANNSNELITAPGIDSLLIRGDATHKGAFQGDLTVTGPTKLLAFTVTGTMSNSRVQIAGDVGMVKLGGLVRSDFLVGVTAVPSTLADFGAIQHKIDKFKILNSAGPALNDSRIAAAKFGSISVAKVKGASGVADFGFIADRIASYQVGATTKQGLDAPRRFDRHGHYVARLV